MAMPKPPGQTLIPAIGYIRVSMMLEEKISPDIQRAAIKDLARRRGYHIVRWIPDLDVSGRTFQRKIMGAIADVEAGKAQAILVWKYSRFGRNRTGNQLNLARLEKAGGQLISATEEVDATTAVGKLTRGVLFELAAFESDRSGEQWAEAFQNRLARGLPPLGGDYFGYVRRGRSRHPLYHDRTIANPDDGKERYEPDHASGTAGVLAKLYDWWIAERNFKVLARWLNDHGYFTPGGARWNATEVRRMMDRGFGAGLICVHNPDCRCGKASRCWNKAYYPGAHEPVISKETWEAYRRYRKITRDMPVRARRAAYPFSKWLRCGYSGHTMYAQIVHHSGTLGWVCGSVKKPTPDEVCGSRFVTNTAVENAVLDILAEWLPEIETAAQAAPQFVPVVKDTKDRVLRKDLERIDRELERQTDLLVREVIPETAYVRVRDRLLAEREEVVEELGALEEQPEPVNPLDCVPVIEGLIQEWHSLPPDRLRNILAEVIHPIEVYRENPATAWIVVRSVWGEERRRDLPSRYSRWSKKTEEKELVVT